MKDLGGADDILGWTSAHLQGYYKNKTGLWSDNDWIKAWNHQVWLPSELPDIPLFTTHQIFPI